MFIAELFNGAPKTPNTPELKNELVSEANAPKLVALYPGRFQPFHMGHNEVFQALQNKFGRDNVYIATSNKTDGNKSPFNFSDKVQLMNAAGVPTDRILETASPYKLPAQFDAANTVFVVVVGAPDAARLQPDSTKKDGSESYFKMFKSLAECTTADKHGYCIIADERHKVITLLGQQVDVSHGTPSRAAWNMVRNNPQGRSEYLKQMFGRDDPELGRILDKIPAAVGESLEEGAPIVVMPMLKRPREPEQKSTVAGSFRQGVEAAKAGKPYNNPYPFDAKLGADRNYDHNSFKRGYKSVSDLSEGIFDRFKKKPEAAVVNEPITAEERAFITKHIPHNNADTAYSTGEYVLPANVTAYTGKARINFYKRGGQLIADVGFYRGAADAQNPRVSPIGHFDEPISSDADMQKLKTMVAEGTTMNKPQGPRQMDPEELDSLVTSIGQKAKQGQMKTVWVPDQYGRGGRYKVVPVTDAPVEEDAAPMTREDYMARRKSLQQLQMDPKVTRDPAVRKELIKKIAQLTMQARSAGVLPESVYAAHVQENRLFEARAIVNTIKYLKESAVEEGVVDHISHAYKGVKRAAQGKPSKIDVELKHRKKALGHSMDQIDDLANFMTSRGSKQADDQFNSTQAKYEREVARANKVEKLGPKK